MQIFMKKSQINFIFWYAINHASGIFGYNIVFKTRLESSSTFINISKIYSKIINILGGGGLEYELEKNPLPVPSLE